MHTLLREIDEELVSYEPTYLGNTSRMMVIRLEIFEHIRLVKLCVFPRDKFKFIVRIGTNVDSLPAEKLSDLFDKYSNEHRNIWLKTTPKGFIEFHIRPSTTVVSDIVESFVLLLDQINSLAGNLIEDEQY